MRKTPLYVFLLITIAALVGCAASHEPAVASHDLSEAAKSYQYFLRGRLKALDGDEKGAAKEFQKGKELAPANPYFLIEEAKLLTQHGQLQEANSLVDQALERDGDLRAALLLRAHLATIQRQFPEAIQALEKVSLQDPESLEIKLALAEVYYRNEQYEDALGALNGAIELSPDFMPAYEIKAVIYEEHLNDFDQAVAVYRQILSYDAENIKVLNKLVQLELKREDDRAAIGYLKKLSDITPFDVTIPFRIVLIHYEAKRFKDAERELENIQKRFQNVPRIDFYLAVLYRNTGRLKLAEKAFKKIASDSPLYKEAQIHLASIAQEKGQLPKAESIIIEALKKKPHEEQLYEALINLQRQQSLWKSVLETTQAAIKNTDGDEKFLYIKGVMQDRLGDFDAAIATMEEVLKINSLHSGAMNYIGYLYAYRGIKLELAEKLIRKALALQPGDPHILDSLGWVYFQRGDYEEAQRYLLAAYETLQEEPEVLEHLGDVSQKLGDKTAARKYYQAALKHSQKKGQYVPPETIPRIKKKLTEL